MTRWVRECIRASVLRQALVAFKKNCSSFLEHKDDFDVEHVHDRPARALPAHQRTEAQSTLM